jgi:hypothetical protein
MDTQPIQIRCACCEQTDTADIAVADFDALAAALADTENADPSA